MKLTRWILYLLIVALLVAATMFYSWIFKYLISSIICAYILNPWVSWLERKHVPRILGILISYILIGFLLAWGVMRVIPVIISQADSLVSFVQLASSQGEISLLKVPFIQNLLQRVDYLDSQVPILNLHDQFIKLVQMLNKSLMNIPNLIIHNYKNILEAVTLIASIPLITFFLLKDNVRFRKAILGMFPNRYFELAVIIMHKIDDVIGKYLRAMFYEVLIVGSLASIVLTALGVPYSLLIGFMAGVANIIPYFGPWLGALFAILSILIAGFPPVMIIYVGIGMYLIQVVDNNLVYPMVVGMTIDMHPLIVLLTVMAGGWAFGLLGMLVSVPIVFLLYSVTKVLYINLKEFKMI